MADASSASDTRIAHFLFDGIMTTVTNFVDKASTSMMQIIGPTAVALLTIYVLLWGLGIASGKINEPFTDGMQRIARMSIIVSLALTASIYQSNVSTFFLNAPSAIATKIMNDTTQPTDGTCEETPNETVPLATMMDTSLCQGVAVGQKMWQVADNTSFPQELGFYGVAILTYIAVVLITGIAAGLLFLTFIGMAVLLAVGPMFILLAIFPANQSYFERWLGQLVNFAVLFILIGATCSLVMASLSTFYQQILADLRDQDPSLILIDFIKVVGMVIACVLVLLQTRGIASHLGGGVQLMGQGLMGKIRQGLQMGTGAGRAALTGSSQKGYAEQRKAQGLRKSLSQKLSASGMASGGANLARRVWSGTSPNSMKKQS